MVIHVKESLIHWNYFLAIENDLSQVARYIEFDKNNFKTYSIELAHILLAASSEVDVIAKSICKFIQSGSQADNINQYREIIVQNLPGFSNEQVFIPRYGLSFIPFSKWKNQEISENPKWWKSYNNVKHERDHYFHEANLQNALNSIGALLITTFYFYKLKLTIANPDITNREITLLLAPESGLLKLDDNYYYDHLVA